MLVALIPDHEPIDLVPKGLVAIAGKLRNFLVSGKCTAVTAAVLVNCGVVG